MRKCEVYITIGCILLGTFIPFFSLWGWTQTDWSGGDSQLLWPSPTGTSTSKYWWGSEVDGVDTPGDLYLSLNGVTYTDTGILFSSWRDAQTPVWWKSITWLSQDAVVKKTADTRGLWYLDQGGNALTAYDLSGYNNHAVLSSGVTWATGRLGYPGDYCLYFSSGSYAEVSSPNSALYLSHLTVECWVYPEDASRTQTILSLGNGKDEGWWLGISSEVAPAFRVRICTTNGTFTATDPDSFSINTWYHLAFTYDGNLLVLYVNGIPKYSVPASGDIVYTSPPPFRISDSTDTFLGKVDLIRITAGDLPEDVIFNHSIPTYIIFYARDGDTPSTDTDTLEMPSSGWSYVYPYGNENYINLVISRWADNFNDNIIDTSLWNVWGESSKVGEKNGRLKIDLASEASGVTSKELTGEQVVVDFYVFGAQGITVSEISNQDTGYLQEGVKGDTGYRLVFQNDGGVYAQYINDGVMEDSHFLGSYDSDNTYFVEWKRWNLPGHQEVSVNVEGIGNYTFSDFTTLPQYLTLYSTQQAHFDEVEARPISRYLQYRVYLKTFDTSYSPVLNEVQIIYEPYGGDTQAPLTYICLLYTSDAADE